MSAAGGRRRIGDGPGRRGRVALAVTVLIGPGVTVIMGPGRGAAAGIMIQGAGPWAEPSLPPPARRRGPGPPGPAAATAH
jgi:hypothetical protein